MDAVDRVRLAPGAEELGLPLLLKDLIEQNLAQHPDKLRVFTRMRGSVGLTVTDAEVTVTLAFDRGVLTIHPGIWGRPGLFIRAASETVMTLSTVRIRAGLPWCFDEAGREVVAAARSGRLQIGGLPRRLPTLLRLARVMSVY